MQNQKYSFEALVRQPGLEFAPLHGNVRDLMGSEAGVSITETGANPIKFVRESRGIAHDDRRDAGRLSESVRRYRFDRDDRHRLGGARRTLAS